MPPQALDPFGKRVDELELFTGVLVEQQVELVEGRPCHQPVVLLVQGIKEHGVGEDSVQVLDTIQPRLAGSAIGTSRGLPNR